MPVGLIDHFNVVIAPSQVDETLRFYREVLGLVEGFRPDFDRPGWRLYAGDHPVLQIFFRDTATPMACGSSWITERARRASSMPPSRIGRIAALHL